MKVSVRLVSLLLLVMQTVASVMMIRLASVRYVSPSEEEKGGERQPEKPPVRFLNTTVVALAEVFKFGASFVALWAESGFKHPAESFSRLRSSLFARPLETLKLGIPASLYTLQNNLVFVALANLSGAVYQVTYQAKILTTAGLSVLILRKRLSTTKWASLLLLTVGVILIQLATLRSLNQAPQGAKPEGFHITDLRRRFASVTNGQSPVSREAVNDVPEEAFITSRKTEVSEDASGKEKVKGEPGEQAEQRLVIKSGDLTTGLAAVIAACFTSAFAGVYLEKLLQESPESIWVRNIQLAAFGMLFGFSSAFWNDGDRLRAHGFFQGYTPLVWGILLLQGIGGLIVAAVLKHAGNILKCFGNAASIVLSCLLSWWLLGDYTPNLLFCIGAALVILATCIYTVGVSPLLDFTTYSRVAVLFRNFLSGLASGATTSAWRRGHDAYAPLSTQHAEAALCGTEMTESKIVAQQSDAPASGPSK